MLLPLLKFVKNGINFLVYYLLLLLGACYLLLATELFAYHCDYFYILLIEKNQGHIMKKLCSIFIIFAFTAAAWTADDNLFSQAGTMLTKGEFTQAVELYEKFVKDNPDDRLAAAAIFNAASIRQLELTDNKTALKGFQRLIKQYPASPYTAEAHRRCGEINQEMGKLERAFHCFTKAIAAAADHENTPDFWLNQIAEQSRSCLEKIDNRDFQLEGYIQLLTILPYGEGILRFNQSISR